jgi:hypothetical protein
MSGTGGTPGQQHWKKTIDQVFIHLDISATLLIFSDPGNLCIQLAIAADTKHPSLEAV